MSKSFKEEHMLNLKGKNYLPVAARVVMFRKDHPTASVMTDTKQVGDDTYVTCAIMFEGRVVATAHKRVRLEMKGKGKSAAADWPLETAETGAVGRALALCGYGTLAGDLDEGDELADAPVGDGDVPDVTSVLEDVAAADPESEEWEVLKADWRNTAKLLNKADRALLVKAVKDRESNA